MLRLDFDYLLKNKVLTISGSLQSELQRRSKTDAIFLPRFFLEREKDVYQVQRDFAEAGSQILLTGTASANRALLQKKDFHKRGQEVNARAVAIARKAVPPSGLIFGSFGTTGALLKPYGQLTEADYREIYQEQAEFLLQEGVDGFILEGFSSLIEAEQCILALREICSLPIIATMTILEDGGTKFGDTLEDCFLSLSNKGADVVGIHGTLGPLEIDSFLSNLQRRFPLCIRPNAGYPVRMGKLKTYLSSPDYVAECAELFVERGAVIVGGAAGFTPEHIKAVASRLRDLSPVQAQKTVSEKLSAKASGTESTSQDSKPQGPTLAQRLAKESVISVELEPPKGLEVEGIMDLLCQLKPLGVDAVNIPENPLARARVSSIALAKVIYERTGIESIAHVTCRDRNLISLQAELLGAHLLGVNNILALTGDPASVGDYPSATSIFDVDSQGLVEIMARMNIGKDFGMNDLGSGTRFNIGVAVNPLAPDLASEVDRLEHKLKRGATFVQTQPIFEPSSVKPFLEAVRPFRVGVIFGVMLVRDYRHAKFLINEYPGIHINEKDMNRFRDGSQKEQNKLGVHLAQSLIKEFRQMGASVYLMPTFGESDRLVDVFQGL